MPIALITGANAGLGLATAEGLGRAGYDVILAVRNVSKGEAAAAQVRRAAPDAAVEVMPLDLASLTSIREHADAVVEQHPRLDVLVNNAGVTIKTRAETTDGFEMTFGVNHLGHFLLTNLLHAPLAAAGGTARVVVVASDAHRFARGGLDFDDLMYTERKYAVMRCYGASKLANMLFARQLAQRWRGGGVC